MNNYKSGMLCLLAVSLITIGVVLAVSPNNRSVITSAAGQERKKAQTLDDISTLRPIDAAPEAF